MAKECVVWHLSDLHFESNTDNMHKNELTAAIAENRSNSVPIEKYLKTFHDALKQNLKPHIIVITGDIANKGFLYEDKLYAKRLDSFFDILENFVEDKHIIVIPGNHDVKKETRLTDTDSQDVRFEAFNKYFGGRSKILTPKKISDPTQVYDEGIRIHQEKCIHFINYGLLFYLFNSSEILGGVSKGLIQKIENEINTKKFCRKKINNIFNNIVENYLENLDILDAAIVSDTVPDVSLDNVLKIALVHHHISPNLVADVNSYDMVSNAGIFIENLYEAGVKLVLHGHKHEICKGNIEIGSPLRKNKISKMAVVCGGKLNIANPNASFNIFLFNEQIADYDLVRHTLCPVEFADNCFKIRMLKHQRICLDLKQAIYEDVAENKLENIALFKNKINKNATDILQNMLSMNGFLPLAPYIIEHLIDDILYEINKITSPFNLGNNETEKYNEKILKLLKESNSDSTNDCIINTMMGNIDEYAEEDLGDYGKFADEAINKNIVVKNLLMIPLKRYASGEIEHRYEMDLINKIYERRFCQGFSSHKDLFEMKCTFLDESAFPLNKNWEAYRRKLGSLDCFILQNNKQVFHKIIVGELSPGSKLSEITNYVIIENKFVIEKIVSNLNEIYDKYALSIKDNCFSKYVNMAIQKGNSN